MIKEIIYILIAIILSIFAVKFMIWALPIILVILVAILIYSSMQRNKNNNNKKKNIKVIYDENVDNKNK